MRQKEKSVPFPLRYLLIPALSIEDLRLCLKRSLSPMASRGGVSKAGSQGCLDAPVEEKISETPHS